MAREQLSEPAYRWNGFAGRQDLAAALAGNVAARLTKAIDERGGGLLAVSGGTTPAKFFAALSAIPIAWNKVTVTLVDERFVPASSPRSNAGLVAANLLQNAAAAATFIRALDAGQLAHTGLYVEGIPALTVDQWIRYVLIGHITTHLTSIRGALGLS